jgi:signal transduction histidine kinase
MATQPVTAPPRASEQDELTELFRAVNRAAEQLASDPQWESLSAALKKHAERGRFLVRGLADGATCDLIGVVDCASQFAGDVLRAMHIPGIEFYRDIEPGICLPGKAACWERVLLKLLVNAGEAMKQGGIVEIHARCEEARIEISIADNGSGISEDALPHVFKPTSFRNRGAGAGLHIVEAIVRRSGGRITAANRNDTSGTIFRLSIPV